MGACGQDGSCEHDNECTGLKKCGEFVDYPRNSSVPKVLVND